MPYTAPTTITTRMFFVSIALFISGCINMDSSSGTPIDASKVAQIVKGKTTRTEVESLLGKPEMTTLIGDGKRMLAYSYTSTQLGVKKSTVFLGPFAKAEGSTRIQSLQIFVNKEGIIEDYEFSDNIRDIEGSALKSKSTLRQ